MLTSRSPNMLNGAVLVGLLLPCCAACQPALETRGRLWTAPSRDSLEVTSAPQGNWPGFRGGSAAGVAHPTRLPADWSSGKNLLWRVELPGWGKSSPIVWDESVVLTVATPGSEAPELAVLCLDRTSGSQRWRADLGPALDPRYTINGLAATTPATDGQSIYVSFGSNGLFCLDFDGQIRWHAALGQVRHDWGFASSPVLFGDLVIQLCDHKNEAFIAAFDKHTGQQVWRTERQSYGCWSTPVLVTAESEGTQRSELVVNGTGTDQPGGGWVIAYDPLTGSELWRVQGTTDSVWPSAIVGAGMVFSTSGRNGPVLAIRPGGSGDVTHSHLEWRKRRGAPFVPTGLAYRNRLYLLTDAGVLTCLNAANGEEIWRERLEGIFSASLVAGDGKIYAVGERGRAFVVAAADEFNLLAVNEINERVMATPAISHGQIFIRSESQLVCIGGADDEVRPLASDLSQDGRQTAKVERPPAGAAVEEEISSPSDLALPAASEDEAAEPTAAETPPPVPAESATP